MENNGAIFRNFYQQYVAVPVTEKLTAVIDEFPGADKANYILTYGYIDHEAGMTLEVLAAAMMYEAKFTFAETNPEISSKIRIGSIKPEECYFFDDTDGSIYHRYQEKVDNLKDYSAGEEVEETRRMEFLDPYRSPEYPDDVCVYLIKDGNKPEGCWVRIEAPAEKQIIGILLNEPDQDFGYHQGEKIAFFEQELEDGRNILCSNMNPSARITAEDLEDGTMLEDAIHAFNEERTEDHFLDILEILRDSYVWIPCNAVMSDEDQARFMAMLEEQKEDIVGKNFVTLDETRLVPDILQNGDNYFFPVFANEAAMGDYRKGFSIIQKHFLEAITLAMNNEKDLSGIVVNAFTEPFVLDKELWDLVQKMKTRIVDN